MLTVPQALAMALMKPVYAGDTVRFSAKLTDKRASASRPGWGLAFARNTGVNQRGEPVFAFDSAVFHASATTTPKAVVTSAMTVARNSRENRVALRAASIMGSGIGSGIGACPSSPGRSSMSLLSIEFVAWTAAI